MSPLVIRLLVYALIVAAAFASGWVKGNEHGTQKLVDYIGEQAKEAVRIIRLQGEVTERIVTRYIKVKGKTETVTRTIEKEVIKYAENNPGYCLDAAWRVHHDSAANNVVPAPGPTVDGEAGAPKAAEALAAVTTNYAACHRTADRLEALQAWVTDQQKVR